MFGLPIESKMMIDLHGKSVQEVKKTLAENFARIEEKHIVEFYIITGRGNHPNADGSRGVLKKILPKLLKPYSANISELNSEIGAYKVVLKKQTERNPLRQMLDYIFDDEQQAKKSLLERVQHDDVNALMELALIHLTDAFKDFSDPQKAIDLLERAKKLGAIDAYLVLGDFYLKKSNYNEAIKHFRYAAEHNDPIGQLGLAGCYLLGQGVKQSDEQAVYWMTKAADQGQVYAQYNLGRSYFKGEFAPQNSELAIKYLTLAADQGMPESMVFLARCYASGEVVKQDSKKAFDLYLQAAQWDDTYALHQVGQYFLDGRSGFPPSKQKAFSWFMRAAKLGDSDSQGQVAIHYFYDDKEKDIEKGLMWLQKSIDQKNKFGYYLMGRIAWQGITGERDEQKAYNFIKLAADVNCAPAQFDLAAMLFTGANKAVKQDEIAGRQWLQKAAELDYPPAVSALQGGTDDDIRAALFQSEFAIDKKLYAAQVQEFHKLDKWLNSRSDNYKFLVQAAQSGSLVAQALVLPMTGQLLSSEESASISKSIWQHSNEEILALPDVKLKFAVVDAYITSKNLTEKQSTKILFLLNVLAQQKRSQAFLRLGLIYFKELLSYKRDVDKAEHYWLKGAELGCSHCLCFLGYLFKETGSSDPVKYEKAFNYHERAAKLGNANSCNELALFYQNGQFVKKDIKKAVEYFHEAMRLDSGEMKSKQKDGLFYTPIFSGAAYNLAVLYWEGDMNFPSDKERAKHWFKKAAEAGDEDAQKILKQISSTKEITHLNFWEASKNKSKSEEINLKEVLNAFSKSLGLEVKWNITKKDQAWCYINPDELPNLENYSLKPFALRKTEDKRTILVLEKVSDYNLLEITNNITGIIKKI